MLRYLRSTTEFILYPGPPGPDATESEVAALLQLWATCDAKLNSYDDGRGVTGMTLTLETAHNVQGSEAGVSWALVDFLRVLWLW
jgi:hypothetical protein